MLDTFLLVFAPALEVRKKEKLGLVPFAPSRTSLFLEAAIHGRTPREASPLLASLVERIGDHAGIAAMLDRAVVAQPTDLGPGALQRHLQVAHLVQQAACGGASGHGRHDGGGVHQVLQGLGGVITVEVQLQQLK